MTFGTVNVQVRGLKQLKTISVHLNKDVNTAIRREMGEFMKRIKISAKLRAPKHTGRLAQSIRLMKVGKNSITLVVDSPYGAFQELGFRPHWIHSSMSDREGGLVGPLFNVYPPKQSFFFVSKFTPFIEPSVKANLRTMPERFSKSLSKAVRKRIK